MPVDMNTQPRNGLWGTSGMSPRAELGAFLGAKLPLGLAQRLPEGPLRTAVTAALVPVAAVGALSGALIGAAVGAIEKRAGSLPAPLSQLKDRFEQAFGLSSPATPNGPAKPPRATEPEVVKPATEPAAKARPAPIAFTETPKAAAAPEADTKAARAAPIAFTETAPVPDHQVAFARGTAGPVDAHLSHGRLEMNVRPSSEKLASALPAGYDAASNRVFARVPEQTAQGVEWKNHYLRPGSDNSSRLSLDVQKDNAGAVLANGVAFGVETNVGTAWLQRFAENYAPTRI